jgi:hypothetical protein
MSKHKKHPNSKDNHGRNQHGGDHNHTNKKMIHHDWRFWTAIVLMLLGMVAYVVSFDESLRPGGGEQPEVPAMAE